MDLFTGLVLIQQDTQKLVLKQYQYGLLLDACAVALGARPPHMVTLYTGVLGRPVYSVLKEEDTQSGAGQSAEDQRRTAEMLYMMLNKGGKFAEQGQILFDPNLSNSEKGEKWLNAYVNEFGGPVGAIMATLTGLSTVGGAIGGSIYKVKQMLNESNEKKLMPKIEILLKDNAVKPLVEPQSDLLSQINAIVQAYKKDQENIARMRIFVGDDDKPIDWKQLKEKVTDLVNKLPEDSNNNGTMAIVKWLASSLESVAYFLGNNKIKPIQIVLPDGNPDIDPTKQGKIGQVIRYFNATLGSNLKPDPDESKVLSDTLAEIHEGKYPEDKEKLERLQKKMNAAIKTNSDNLLIAFRNESLIVRFVLEKLIN